MPKYRWGTLETLINAILNAAIFLAFALLANASLGV